MTPLDGRDVPGPYNCRLWAEMLEFPTIRSFETFGCNISGCTAQIFPNGARGPNLLRTYWGRMVASFDISSELAKYTAGPTCGQLLKFRVTILDVNGTPGNYREVNCNDLATCYVEKCNGAASTNGDTDCDPGELPYDMYFTVVVTAYFEDGTFDESITFPVEILDPCGSDKVSFDVPPSDLITYTLKTPAEAAFDPYVVR